MYLTIPDVVEQEEMLGLSPGSDGKTFGVVIGVGETAVRLMRAATNGDNLPLVVLTTDAQVIALDSVYVAEVSQSAEPPTFQVTFVAGAVRLV